MEEITALVDRYIDLRKRAAELSVEARELVSALSLGRHHGTVRDVRVFMAAARRTVSHTKGGRRVVIVDKLKEGTNAKRIQCLRCARRR